MPIYKWAKSEKYLAVCMYSMKSALRQPWHLIGLGLLLISCLLIFSKFWLVVNSKVGHWGIDSSQMLWYITFNEWLILSIPSIHSDIANDLRYDLFASRLILPASYLGIKLVEGIGELLITTLFLGVLSFLFVGIVQQNFPFSFSTSCLFIALNILAGVMMLIFQMIIGLMAFWLRNIMPYYWIWEKMMFVFGGLFIPLTLYPQWLSTMAYLTPFSAALGIRSALVFNCTTQKALLALSALLLWSVVGVVIVLVLFRKAKKSFMSGKQTYA